MTFTAQYHGTCGSCDEPIHPGDSIEYTDVGAVYVHTACDDTQTETEKALVICPSCYLTTPCGCEDD